MRRAEAGERRERRGRERIRETKSRRDDSPQPLLFFGYLSIRHRGNNGEGAGREVSGGAMTTTPCRWMHWLLQLDRTLLAPTRFPFGSRFALWALREARERERKGGKKTRNKKKKTISRITRAERCDESSSMGPRDWCCARARKRWSRKEAGSPTTSAPLQTTRGENYSARVIFLSAGRGAARRCSLPRYYGVTEPHLRVSRYFQPFQDSELPTKFGECIIIILFHRNSYCIITV